MTSKRIFT